MSKDMGASFGPGCEASPSASKAVFAESHPSREEFVGWIADRFQEKHVPPLARDKALSMAEQCLAYSEADAPFGHPDYCWDRGGACDLADDEIETCWETAP